MSPHSSRASALLVTLRSAALVVTFATAGGASLASAEDFTDSQVAAKWRVTQYHGKAPNPVQRPSELLIPEGGVGMAFLPTPDIALLTTESNTYVGDLVGNLTGKTIHAEIAIVRAMAPVYNYYQDGCPAPPANVRLYFRTHDHRLGESQYWWSNPESELLQDMTSARSSLDAALNPANWSDRDGHFGTFDAAHQAAFAAAVADVEEIGVSFGGGCHFAFGVGVASGSATFQLARFTAVP